MEERHAAFHLAAACPPSGRLFLQATEYACLNKGTRITLHSCDPPQDTSMSEVSCTHFLYRGAADDLSAKPLVCVIVQ